MSSPTTFTALGLDQFVHWVKTFVGHSADWATEKGFDYKNIYNDQLQYQAVNAFISNHNSELLSQSVYDQAWVPYVVYAIAIELFVILIILFRIYGHRRRKYRYVQHDPIIMNGIKKPKSTKESGCCGNSCFRGSKHGTATQTDGDTVAISITEI